MINVNQLYLQVKGKWKSVYPIYFDSTKTLAQGRRLPKSLCIQNPKLQQLAIAISKIKIRNIVEPHKSYSRDYFCVGRIKVQLVDDKNTPIKQNIPNRILFGCEAFLADLSKSAELAKLYYQPNILNKLAE